MDSNQLQNLNTAAISVSGAIIVTNTNDSGPGSLRNAINTAMSGDTIVFDVAIQNATITLTSPIIINKTLTISGPGPTISGGNKTRIFIIGGGLTTVITIRAISIVNGFSSDAGGAILNADATLNVIDCVFSNNKSNSSGGAIANISGIVNIVTSTFFNNTASFGGAIGNFPSGKVNIINSTLFSNTTANNGGAFANDGTTIIINSTFSGNIAANNGGAIANDGTATIANSLFLSNIATNNGGAIANIDSGTINIINSLFLNNKAANGGAIANIGSGTVAVINSTFFGNSTPVIAGTIIIITSNFI